MALSITIGEKIIINIKIHKKVCKYPINAEATKTGHTFAKTKVFMSMTLY